MNSAPLSILFLVFNRPEVTRRSFEAIARAQPKRLFVAADGPRLNKEGEAERCEATRAIIKRVDWDCEVKTLFRDTNLGCKQAVSSAIDWFFEHVEEGIILEDDCLPADSFFPFCSELLEKYRDDERVMMISGDNFQDGIWRGDASYYFSRIFHIWGWATWRRAWQLYDQDMRSFFSVHDKSCLEGLDRNVALSWEYAFSSVHTGRIKTWDYPWVYSCLLNNGLSVAPNRNLVSNIGFGLESTHTTNENSRESDMERFEIERMEHPSAVFCNEEADCYEYRNLYPYKDGAGVKYRLRRYRKARRLRKKIKQVLGITEL